MGLFSRLFGRTEDPEEPEVTDAVSDPAPEAFEELDDAARVELLAEQLRRFGERCERVGVRVEPGSECELRAVWQGRPIRIEIEEDGDGEVVLGTVNRRGQLCLLPAAGEVVEGAFVREPTEVVCVAVGPGVSLSTFAAYLDADRRTWESLPAPMRQRMVGRATREQRVLNVGHQSIASTCSLGPAHGRSVVDAIEAELRELLALATVLGEGAAPIEPRSSVAIDGVFVGGSSPPTPCAFCGTRYWVERSDPRCPSCGAPAS